jgi:Kdo2-lipid IVA lauroyltransferase/acyltransferase
LIDSAIILFIKAVQTLLRLLPEKGQRRTGILLGRCAFRLLRDRRRIAVSNLHRAFPLLTEKDRLWIAHRSFENLGVNFIEMLLIPFVPKDEYAGRFPLEGRHIVDEALKLKRGVISLVFHFANWEIMGVAAAILEREIVVLARPLKRHARLNRFLNSLRVSTGLKILPNAETAMEVIRLLKGGAIVGILSDQREKRSRAVYVEFFGEDVPTNKGTAMIAMKTKAPVISCHLVREGFLRYRIIFGEQLPMERKGDLNGLIASNTRKINAFLESIIRQYPDEWFWVHRRWGRDR